MPFCPSCGLEYSPGVTRCADCDVELTAEAAASTGSATDEEWVTVYGSHGPIVGLVEDALRAQGVPVVRLPDQRLTIGAVGIFGTTETNYYRLCVPPGEYAARKDEIDELIAGLGTPLPETDEPDEDTES